MKKVILIICAVVLLIAIGVTGFAVYVTNYDYVSGVTWNGKVFNSSSDIQNYIRDVEKSSIIVTYEDKEFEIPLSGLIDFDSAPTIYNNIVACAEDNKWSILKKEPVAYEYEPTFNDSSLGDLIASTIEPEVAVPVKNSIYTVGDTKIYFANGHDGKGVDVDVLKTDIADAVKNQNYDAKIPLTLKVVEFNKYNFDNILKEETKEPVNAGLETKDGKTYIVKAQKGIYIDEGQRSVVESNMVTPDFEFSIPLSFVEPQVTEIDTTGMFDVVLGTYSSTFATGGGRGANVSLAAKYCDGTILNPGEEFSYTDLVGPTTAARGYKEATVYENGKAVPGMGGGVCQGSSTLYCAALKADLEITERHNHSLYVTYVPKGLDATVSTGVLDLKFKNNYNYPIMISCKTSGGKFVASILGRQSTGKVVELWSKNTKNSPGWATWTSYRTVTVDGVTTAKNEVIATSTYKIN